MRFVFILRVKVLLSRLRLFLSPGYPYEEILRTFHNQTGIVMCSYLPIFKSFNRTKGLKSVLKLLLYLSAPILLRYLNDRAFSFSGGLIQLNHGRPQPLQYVVNAAFLATVYSDYLDAADTPGWYCGPNFFSTDVLRNFAKTQVFIHLFNLQHTCSTSIYSITKPLAISQIDYILGNNPQKMSYIVGFGNRYPKHVHHRGASIPKNGVKYNCKGGWKWRDTHKPNPHTIIGAMVAGPDKHDGFHDVRMNYNYTEPTLAGNAGLVAALVALSSESNGVDKNTIFSAVPPMTPTPPPPPAPWKP